MGVLALCVVGAPGVGRASQEEGETNPTAEDSEPPDYSTTVRGTRPPSAGLPLHGPRSTVTRDLLELRLPRSAPDALRYEPGVFVQQTAHGQGSAFIRGLTGQQTLLMFDGIRLNNSTYRQGPNQYFFTLDAHTIGALQVMRGGASTRYGSDALGGVIMALPLEAPGRSDAMWVEPHLRYRGATADDEHGGRLQLAAGLGEKVTFLGGVGGRAVGQLQSGGTIVAPQTGEPPLVPRFGADGRTQLGTGFNELTADGRLVWRPADNHRVTVASYAYRQFDSPRTDQCPAAYAPFDECLNYDEQFRTLVYAAWDAGPDYAALRRSRLTLSWQRQHELRTLSRPGNRVENVGRDTVDSFGVTFQGETAAWEPWEGLRLSVDYGADNYVDTLASAAWIRFTDTQIERQRSRGQYLNGSTYIYGGAFVQGLARLGESWRLRAGTRVGWAAASAPGDPTSGSAAVNQMWVPWVGNVGVQWDPLAWLRLQVAYDHSYRAPNLDDLTSRQQTGPGFQFENPDLQPERAHTLEVGTRLLFRYLLGELWAFHTRLEGAVMKSPREVDDCPVGTERCRASWSRFQLVNAPGASAIWGVEAAAMVQLPGGFSGRTTVAWTWGEGPNVGDRPSDPMLPFQERVPLSRMPPLNGTVELLWNHDSGLSLGSALRWAAAQDRLALADVADERIPLGGTPGFAVWDLRVSYRLERYLLVSAALENVLDEAYRYHGSSVNGPGRGLTVMVDLGPW